MSTTFSLFLIIISLSTFSIIEAAAISNNGGFSTDLLFLDYPPWSYASKNATLSSFSRAHYHNAAYTVKLSIGTPPMEAIGIISTHSDFTWTSNQPCMGHIDCSPNKSTNVPLYEPKNSSTYKNLPCKSHTCQEFSCSHCDDTIDACTYEYSYSSYRKMTKKNVVYGNYHDDPTGTGFFSTDTFTFGPSVSFENVAFGCSTDYTGNFYFNKMISGVIGLGPGNFSLVNQLGQGKFSYCLAGYNRASRANFGNKAIVLGPGVVSTPFVTFSKDDNDFGYYVKLENITIGNKTLPYQKNSSEASDIRIGFETITFLPSELYDDVVSAMTKAVVGGEPVKDRSFPLCYKNSSNVKFPKVTYHFVGANLDVDMFVQVEEEVACLALDWRTHVGDLALTNTLVGFDLVSNMAFFKASPSGCT